MWDRSVVSGPAANYRYYQQFFSVPLFQFHFSSQDADKLLLQSRFNVPKPQTGLIQTVTVDCNNFGLAPSSK